MNEESIVLGGGCFWCLEALYQRVREVNKVVSGYSGGAEENPTYESTHGPRNTHAEVVNVSFDPDIISIETILEIFYTFIRNEKICSSNISPFVPQFLNRSYGTYALLHGQTC